MPGLITGTLLLLAGTDPAIRVGVTHYPPFIRVDPETRAVSGADIDKLRCTVDHAGRTLEMTPGQITRLEALLHQGRIDAIITLQKTPERDAYGHHLPTGTGGRMAWYMPKDKPFDTSRKDARVGALQADAALYWLGVEGYGNVKKYASHTALFAGLLAGEVEAIYVAEAANLPHEAAGRLRDQLDTRITRPVSGGMYVSKAFAAANPDFMQQFPDAVKDCLTEGDAAR